MIPEEAVEAAARAMNPAVWGPRVWTFQAHGETPTEARNRVQQQALQQARTALEAAAPHMLAKPVKPKHQCEPWQIQVNSSGTFRYCAACGEPQP